jgi:hypothetical protein
MEVKMRILIQIISFFLISYSITIAQRTLPTTENFNYTVGSDLSNVGQDWTRVNGSANDLLVVNGNLSYSGYPMPTEGNMIEIKYNGTDDVKLSFNAVSNGKIYASLLVNLYSNTGLSASGVYFVSLGSGTNPNPNYYTRILVRTTNSGNTFNFGLSRNSNTITWSSSDFNFNQTYLIVLDYEFVSGSANDIVKLWVNPDLSGNEPSPLISTNQNGANDASSIDGFMVRQASGGPNAYIDAIRIGTTWNDAPLPVQINNFNYSKTNNIIYLQWQTVTEVNNYGFGIERKYSGPADISNNSWEKIGFVQGNGNSNSPKYYSFIDKNLLSGYYSYRLKQIDYDGSYTYSDVLKVKVDYKPQILDVKNYPNPFNPITKIYYEIPEDGFVTLKIYNALGKEIKTLINENKIAGSYEIEFDASGLPTGIYFNVLQVGDKRVIRKMQLIK